MMVEMTRSGYSQSLDSPPNILTINKSVQCEDNLH